MKTPPVSNRLMRTLPIHPLYRVARRHLRRAGDELGEHEIWIHPRPRLGPGNSASRTGPSSFGAGEQSSHIGPKREVFLSFVR